MKSAFMRLPLLALWRKEFAGYSVHTFRQDLLAGITVGAVALPLALAFGVASGADAAAGLVTAILAGIIIAGLGGGSFQISGPTGAMSAILIVLAQRHGLPGIWTASLLAGIFLILLGVFRLGRYVSFIPSPVITGFTSGIALIIAIGQLDNVCGITTPQAENALEKVWYYIAHTPTFNIQALIVAGVVMLTMIIFPRITKTIPGSLVGLVLSTILVNKFGWDIPVIGEIPRTIVLDARLTWDTVPWNDLSKLVPPAVAIAALGAIESLLCGTVGATMSGSPFDSNQELVGQGIGNMIIPFLGGVPATAAIARSSVSIKSGGVTRLTSIIHAGVLLLSVFVLSPFIRAVPLAALGGVLFVTAWRMNEWEAIHFFTRRGVRHALSSMLVTMLATVALDLTQAILIGIAISALIYLRQSTESVSVTSAPVDTTRIRTHTSALTIPCSMHVYYLSGPLFFGSVHTVLESFETAREYHTIIISMRGTPLIDATGVQAIIQIVEEQQAHGGVVCLSGLQPAVEQVLRQSGILDMIGTHNIFWSADQAIVALDARYHTNDKPQSPDMLAPFPAHLTVADVMTRDVYEVEQTTPISEIVTLLVDQNLYWLPVVDQERHVVGIITEGDLLRRGIISLSVDMKQLLPLTERAAAVLALETYQQTAADVLMHTPVVVPSTMPLAEAAALMVQHTLKRLPVVNEQGHLVGVLARSDVLSTIAHIDQNAIEQPAAIHSDMPRQVGDVMHRDMPVVHMTTPLEDVLRIVLTSTYRRVVVLNEHRVIGLITDGDVLKRSMRHTRPGAVRRLMVWLQGGTLPGDLAVVLQGMVAADVMTNRIITISHTTPIIPAIQKLLAEDVVGLPVVDEDSGFQGWVDRSVLLQALVHMRSDYAPAPFTPTTGQE